MYQTIALWALLVATVGLSAWKWLRVAQREHYEPGRVSAMVLVWVRARNLNAALGASALLFFALCFAVPAAAIASLVAGTVFPIGLRFFPKTTPLVVTGRIKRLLGVVVLIDGLALALAWLAYAPAGVAVLLLQPLIVDAALTATRPMESAISARYVASARQRLASVQPVVVAITGSYGKTSTKNYAHRIVSGSRRVLASPASFNNILGLSKAINDGLRPGIEVFIAEMGTYGPGEIRRLCRLFKPQIAAITTIGEAHLERMGTRAAIVSAKSEILEDVEIAVLNVDVEELASLARTLRTDKNVIRCSARGPADSEVAVISNGSKWQVFIHSRWCVDIPAPETGHAINLAIAIGIALAVGLPEDRILSSVANGGLTQPSHRAEITRTSDGVVVIDDTYNANPDGAAAALRSAVRLAGKAGKVWTVSPGMIELGRNQAVRNRAFAAEATASTNMRLIVVGYTNRRDLIAGATDHTRVLLAKDRAAAQRFIETDLSAGDVVLYENDLPSHYP